MATNADDTLDIRNKYKTTLNALIDQNYNVINDVYLDMFITHASGKHGEGNAIILININLSYFPIEHCEFFVVVVVVSHWLLPLNWWQSFISHHFGCARAPISMCFRCKTIITVVFVIIKKKIWYISNTSDDLYDTHKSRICWFFVRPSCFHSIVRNLLFSSRARRSCFAQW